MGSREVDIRSPISGSDWFKASVRDSCGIESMGYKFLNRSLGNFLRTTTDRFGSIYAFADRQLWV
jgi:hypothetical protein